MNQKIGRMITVICLIAIVVIVSFFLNGMTIHHIQGINLQQTFLQTLYQRGVTEGAVTREEIYCNSKTLFFENEAGQKAVATYVKSIFGDKWEQAFLLHMEKGEKLKKEGVLFPIDDHIFQYEMKYEQKEDGTLEISLTGKQKPVLAIRLFGIGVVIAAAVVGRIVGVWLGRDKIGRLIKENEKKNKS